MTEREKNTAKFNYNNLSGRLKAVLIILLAVLLLTSCNKEKTTYKITFMSEGKIFAEREMPANFVIELPAPQRDGFIFEGWYFDEDYTEMFTAAYFKETPLEDDIKVYAKWRSEDECKISFYNGDAKSMLIMKGEKYGQLPVPTKNGYIFGGWFTNIDFTVQVMTDDVVNGDIVLYAKWISEDERKKIFLITINNMGGGNIEPIKVKYGETVIFPDNYRISYRLIGYYSDSEYKTEYKPSPVVSDFTIYAKWERVNTTFSLVFHANGGEPINTVAEARYDQEINLPNAVRAGYKFLGWFSDSQFENKVDNEFRIRNSFELYAKWEENGGDIEEDVITITLVLNGGILSFDKITAVIGEYPDLPTPIKDNSEFTGWYLDEDITTIYIKDIVNGAFILYAGWKENVADEKFTAVVSADGKTSTITGYNGQEKVVVVPQTLGGAEVTAVGAEAFKNNTLIERIDLPNTIKEIGEYAFYGCTALSEISNLERLTLIKGYAFAKSGINTFVGGEKLQELGSYAFSESDITSVNLKGNMQSERMGTHLFYFCTSLRTVVLGKTEFISLSMFERCSSLSEISLTSCKTIQTDAFKYSGLKRVELPIIETIKDNAFSGCKLTQLSLDGTISFGYGAFGGNNDLVNIDLGKNFYFNSDISIIMEHSPFANCPSICFNVDVDNSYYASAGNSLMSKDKKQLYCIGGVVGGMADIPEGTEKIKMFCLNGNLSITTINIPASLLSIEQNALGGARNLSLINVDSSNQVYDIREKDSQSNGNLYSKDENMLVRYLPKNENSEYTLMEGTKKIAFGAFADNTYLNKIVLNNTMTEIGFGAFYGAEELSSVTNTDKISNVEGYAFMNTKIEILEFTSENIHFVQFALSGCLSLSKVIITSANENAVFDTCDYSSITLVVQSSSLDNYTSRYSEMFEQIIAVDGSAIKSFKHTIEFMDKIIPIIRNSFFSNKSHLF